MERIYLTFIFCLIAISTFSQKGTIKISKPKPPKNTALEDSTSHLFEMTAISFEQKYFLSNFDKQLKTIKNRNLMLPCNYLSIGMIEHFSVSRGYSFPGYFIFSYLLPTKIELNDSINEKLKGFNLKFSVAGQNVINKKHFEIFFVEGLEVGRLKIVNDKNDKLKNGLLAPYFGIVLRLTISRFTCFAVSQFNYDFSASKWKKTWFSKKQDEQIPGFNQTGMVFSFGIKYRFKNTPTLVTGAN